MAREIDFPTKDVALRDDVRLLGAMVGDIVREQGGDSLFEIVESARAAAIRRREGDPKADAELATRLGGCDPHICEAVVRSFATYFQVVNLGETIHRIRRRREYERLASEGGRPQLYSFHDLLEGLKETGHDAASAMKILARIRIEPVFTAHPTENTRPAILEKRQRIARALVDRLDPSRPPSEERRAIARIRAEVTSAWQTLEHPSERPTVADELEFVLFFLSDVVYRIVPPLYEQLEDAFLQVFGETVRAPAVLGFASWVGGDMDGNPNVSAQTIRGTLARQREVILSRYRGELHRVSGLLTQSEARVNIAPAVVDRAAAYGRMFPAAMERIPRRQRDMSYLVLLRGIEARVVATRDERAYAYTGVDELLEDLALIEESLAANRGSNAGLFSVRRLARRVETFGFHLATLDVRQHAEVHRAVAGRILGDPKFPERSAPERTRILSQALATPPVEAFLPDAADDAVLEVFRAIKECQLKYGHRAIGPYIVSMSQGTDDVLAVLLLARHAGLVEDNVVPLDVAPLFETVPDLEAGPAILRELLSVDGYRTHLATRDNHQMIMIGYSDSNKDGGIAASRWALHRAQTALLAPLNDAGVDITFFHGRGGTISRGGGKTHLAVLSAPEGSLRGRLRTTEQGEMIAAKYGLRGIAMRTLERAAVSVARATASPMHDPREADWAKAMSTIADEARATYRGLVYEHPGFVDYFRSATPIDVIEKMRIGSRPSSRKSGRRVEDLRAIPWVFAWTQSRHLLPGWYGLGTSLESFCQREGIASLMEMADEWPFLLALLADVEMVLAKADMPIATHYADLAGEAGQPIFSMVREEYERTVRMVLQARGRERLLEDDVTLERSIRLRNPYVDPMSLLQIDLLRRWRATDGTDDALLGALVTTVNGIAAGLQNTG